MELNGLYKTSTFMVYGRFSIFNKFIIMSNTYHSFSRNTRMHLLRIPLSYMLIILGFFFEFLVELPFLLVLMIDKLFKRKA